MTRRTRSSLGLLVGIVSPCVLLVAGCGSNDGSESTSGDPPDTQVDAQVDAPIGAPVDAAPGDALTCEAKAATFVTRGSANPELADPRVSASCADGEVTITSNQIPDFPYIETTPGNPREFDLVITIPATPVVAATTTDAPAIGPLGIAINGIPIYGATEGTGGDVLSMPNFVECGGHNGPGGYHYHTFSVVGSDDCLFSEADVSAAPQLFGYAFDGYPIYSGNTRYNSSWYLSDASLFATDTLAAHTYAEGSGDLDRCNGRTDENGDYAYYTTDGFPYTLACFRGEVVLETPGDREPRP